MHSVLTYLQFFICVQVCAPTGDHHGPAQDEHQDKDVHHADDPAAGGHPTVGHKESVEDLDIRPAHDSHEGGYLDQKPLLATRPVGVRKPDSSSTNGKNKKAGSSPPAKSQGKAGKLPAGQDSHAPKTQSDHHDDAVPAKLSSADSPDAHPEQHSNVGATNASSKQQSSDAKDKDKKGGKGQH